MINYSNFMRCNRIDDFIGNETVKKELKLRFMMKDIPKVSLIDGTFGTGKTSLSRIIAMALVCENLDIEGNPCLVCENCQEIQSENFKLTVKEHDCTQFDIKEITDLIAGKKNYSFIDAAIVHILDESQTLTNKHQKMLLKLIEKKRKDEYFIFVSSDISKIDNAIISRSCHFHLKSLSEIDSDELINYSLNHIKSSRINFANQKPNLVNIYPTLENIPLDFYDPVTKTGGLISLFKIKNIDLRNLKTYIDRCVIGKIWSEEEINKLY